jgi:hypothetical protein
MLDKQVEPSVILVHFVESELELHGLEAPPSCQHCAPSSWHSCWKYPWWAKPEWKAEVPWLLVEGQRKMQADFAVVNEVVYALGTWQNRQIPDVHNNHKKDFRKECSTH